MSASIKNLYQFRTTSKITQAQGAASTFTVGNDIFTNSAVAITAWSIQLTNRTGSIVELFTVTVAAWVATIATRWIKPDWTTDAIYQYERPKNTLCTLTVLENQIFDKWGSETLTGNLTYSWNVIYTKSTKFPVYADATARDAWIPSPANGMMIYNTALWLNQQYIGGSWVNVDTGTVTANASDTVAGKVEIATQAEFDAWTATGWTWASVVATNDQIRKQINTATAKTTPVNADSIGISDSAASWVIKKTTLTELKAASDMQATTTTSWFVEMATDAEVATWTDETRYINSKQNKRNVDRITGTRTWSSTGSQTITHTLGKAPTFIFAIANTNSFYLSSVGMWCSEWNSAIWDFSSGVAIEPSLSNSALINFWNIWSDRSLNCSITSVNTTDIVLNRSTIWSWWTIYDVGYTFFVYW